MSKRIVETRAGFASARAYLVDALRQLDGSFCLWKASCGAHYTPATLLQALNLQESPMGWTQKQPTP